MLIDPMLPRRFRIERTSRELHDTFGMELVPEEGGPLRFAPGQFNMLYVFGVGEVPISISGDPADDKRLVHTTRVVGTVTEAMGALKPGATLGVRGPFGKPWPVVEAEGNDVVFVIGGLGLAPLRPAIYHVLANRAKYGKVLILYGARQPADILYRKQLEKWRGRLDLDVHVTVDSAPAGWSGNVGVVTKLLKPGSFDARHAVAMVCGPEIMMRYAALALMDAGLPKDSIYVSMERNMKCAVGFCGHCQLGGDFVCKDGPVFPYTRVEPAFMVREI